MYLIFSTNAKCLKRRGTLFCSGTNLLIDNIVDKAGGLGSWITSDIIIIDVIIRENNKLQNVGNVNVATSHKILYAQSCFTEVYDNNLLGIINIFFSHK